MMLIGIGTVSVSARTHDKDSVIFSGGINLGLGFDANGDYARTPFIFEPMLDVEYCFSNNFLFGLQYGWNYLRMKDSDGDFKTKYNQHTMRCCPFIGFAIGDYDKFNFKIGPTLDLLFGLKSVVSYGREQFVTKLTDYDEDAYDFCALGLRMGVGICGILDVYYQMGLTNHFENNPTIHQVTFVLPLRVNRKFENNGLKSTW